MFLCEILVLALMTAAVSVRALLAQSVRDRLHSEDDNTTGSTIPHPLGGIQIQITTDTLHTLQADPQRVRLARLILTKNRYVYFAGSADNSKDPIYRNVQDYGAKGDGSTNDADAIQTALNAINADGALNRYEAGGGAWMARPAQIFVPSGTYIIDHNIDFRLNSILMINGQDYAVNNPTEDFYMGIFNIIFDTTQVSDSQPIAAIQWGVSQACQLSNLIFNMPDETVNHAGLNITSGSLTALNDLTFNGGTGIIFGNQQANLKGMTFNGCRTGIEFNGVKIVSVQKASFTDCGICIAWTNGGDGGLIFIDSEVNNSGAAVQLHDSTNDPSYRSNQIVIENLQASGSNPLVTNDSGATLLEYTESIDTWIWGNVQQNGKGSWQTPLTNIRTPRSSVLLDSSGKYFTMAQPTYAEYSTSQIVNVKTVSGLNVAGDGSTNDAPNLNQILQQNAAAGAITFFPYVVYSVEGTLVVPAGSRIVGEAWAVIKAQGSLWSDESKLTAVVQVGEAGGDTGVAQVQNMRFTVGDIMPGAKILEVNIAGNPGDVAFWNTHVTVGGTRESKINDDGACLGDDTSKCMAAWALVHLTANSGVYIENMWGWTADHDLDPGAGYPNKIAVGRGMLMEATKGTWLTGTAMEHNTLYNYNFHRAENVVLLMGQTETAYWQGSSKTPQAPGPFTANSSYGDPDFSWCGSSGPLCHMTLGQNIHYGSNLFFYATGDWAFFNDIPNGCSNNVCIYNHARVAGTPTNLYWYGHDNFQSATMILDNIGNPQSLNNPAPWGSLISAYSEFIS